MWSIQLVTVELLMLNAPKQLKQSMQKAFLLLADKYIKCITTSSSHYLVKSHFKVLIIIISIIMLILK